MRLATLVVLTLLLRAPSFVRPFMDIDEGSYAGIACRMLDGGLPYRDGAENKFPGIFYVYTATYKAFGRYNMLAVHLVTALAALLTALVCGAIARRLGGDGFRASLAYTVFSTVYYPKMLAANTEMFVVLPSALAIWCFLDGRRRWLMVAGALGGVATLLKQVAGLMLLPLMTRRRFWEVLLGFTLVLAAAALGLRPVLDDARFWTLTYVFRNYLPSGDHGFFFNLLTCLVPFALAVSPLIFLASRAQAPPVIWWWLASMLAASLVGGRMYGHYFLLMVPPLSVLAGLAARVPRPLVVVSAILAVGFLVYACVFEPATGSLWSPKPDYRRAGEYVRAHTASDERIFVWGWFPPLYQAADRCPSTRFVYTHQLAGAHGAPVGWDMLMHDLEAAPPAYLLDTSHGDYSFQYAAIEKFPSLMSFLGGYQLETEIEGVRLYKRR